MQPEVMQQHGHLPAQNSANPGARHYANAGAYFGPKLCKGKGVFQPDIMQMHAHYFRPKFCICKGIISTRNYAKVGAYVTPKTMQMQGP